MSRSNSERRLKPRTIRAKIGWTFGLFMSVMLLLNVFQIVSLLDMSRRYNEIVERIAAANETLDIVRSEVPLGASFLSSERVPIEDSTLHQATTQFQNRMERLLEKTDTAPSRRELRMILRTTNTLARYTDQLYQQVTDGALYDERKMTVESIETVSDLLVDMTYSYISSEIANFTVVNRSIQNNVLRLLLINLVAAALIMVWVYFAMRDINRSIAYPINELVLTSRRVAAGDLDCGVSEDQESELQVLNQNFNIMIRRLKELMRQTRRDADNLSRIELQLLQEQINPHFLFNTLETIIWSIEAEDTEDSLKLVQELSNFFRMTLSGGRSIIQLRDEISHVSSYLAILQRRYHDILQYVIDVPEELMVHQIPKLTLQPIVENAVYHGIKQKRTPGRVIIRGRYSDDLEHILLTVIDDGVGMPEEELKTLRDQIKDPDFEPSSLTGVGLPNIYRRIKLYYGDTGSLSVTSVVDVGTIVQIKILAKHGMSEDSLSI
ncbi:MAG: sensor histidine kinase [Fastidiosipilaceae bacterium]|jgi:two-component system sensor histidine kinase YesM